MKTLGFLLVLALLASPAFAQWDATDYTISFSSNTDQEAVLRILIHQECARLISSDQPIQAYCTQNPAPDDGNCTCTPTATQKRAFISQRYLVGGFSTDRRNIYLSRGRDLGRLYPSLSKAQRDAMDTAAGKELLP